jgi:thiamine biosynthesis protein ThiS
MRRLRGDQQVRVKARINGKEVELDGPTRLLDYLAGLGLDARAVAVEHNGEILQRDRYEAAMLQDGDVLEIVRMVGGGAPLRLGQ